MTRIAADDDVSPASGEFQVFVILRILAFENGLCRLNPFGRDNHCVQNELTAFD